MSEEDLKERKDKAYKLAEKLLPFFNGLTYDVAKDAIDFLKIKVDTNFRSHAPLVLKEDE